MSTRSTLHPKPRKLTGTIKRLAVWLLILAAWEAAYRWVGWKPTSFASPTQVLDSTLGLLNVSTTFGAPVGPGWPFGAGPVFGGATPGDGSAAPRPSAWDTIRSVVTSPLVVANVVSLLRLAAGFSISVALGSFVGLLMWRFKALDDFIGPLFLGLQTLPSVCWAPIAVPLFGLNEKGILFVLVMGSFFAIAISLRDGLRQIPPIYRRAGHMLGARRLKIYRYVLLPASMPALASSLRSGFSFAWRSLMGAEFVLFAVDYRGLGYHLDVARSSIDAAAALAIIIIMVVIGILADRLVFARLERRVHARFGLAAAA